MAESNSPIEGLTMLALVKAGTVTDDDNFFGLIQGISLENSKAVAEWLCLSTGTAVELRFIDVQGGEIITQTPEALAAKLREKGEMKTIPVKLAEDLQDEINGGLIARLGAATFCVYMAIKTQIDDVTGEQPSLNLLSEQLGMSLEAVYIHIQKLVADGLVPPSVGGVE
jgi:hypothetical protein